MNFTKGVKRELLAAKAGEETLRAQVSAFLRTGGFVSFTERGLGFILVTESERIAEYFIDAFERLYGISCYALASDDRLTGKEKLSLAYHGERAYDILIDLGILEEGNGGGVTAGIAPRLVETDEGRVGYLRGAFLGGGSCTVPRAGAKTGYHLEFVFSYEETANDFVDLLDEFELFAKVVKRKEKYVVYAASLAAVSDFLACVGAYASLERLSEEAKIREENNNGNRVNNCFVGNMDRTAQASARQCVAVGKLKARGGLQALDEELKATALMRLEMPEASLKELADRLGVSKGCVNHRMRRLIALAEGRNEERKENGE